MDQSEMLDEMIFAAENMWFLVVLTASVIMSVEVVCTWIELAAVSAMASPCIWRYDRASEGRASPTL
jgi:hypothetical protein